MKLGLEVTGDIVGAMRAELLAGEKAVTAALREAERGRPQLGKGHCANLPQGGRILGGKGRVGAKEVDTTSPGAAVPLPLPAWHSRFPCSPCLQRCATRSAHQ